MEAIKRIIEAPGADYWTLTKENKAGTVQVFKWDDIPELAEVETMATRLCSGINTQAIFRALKKGQDGIPTTQLQQTKWKVKLKSPPIQDFAPGSTGPLAPIAPAQGQTWQEVPQVIRAVTDFVKAQTSTNERLAGAMAEMHTKVLESMERLTAVSVEATRLESQAEAARKGLGDIISEAIKNNPGAIDIALGMAGDLLNKFKE